MKYHLPLFVAFLAIFIFSSCKVLLGPAGLGDRAFEYGEYNSAIEYYQKAIEKGKDNGKINFQLAESYRLSNRIHQALPYYQRAAQVSFPNETLPFYLGQSLKANEKYETALASFRQYLATGEDRALIALARYESRNLGLIEELPNKEKAIQVSNVDALNSDYPEYGVLIHSNEIYFTSTRSGGKEYKGTGTPFSNIYKSPFQGFPIDSLSVTVLEGIADTPEINEGSLAIHPEGRMMVFARGNSGKKNEANDVNLYITHFRENKWTVPELMNINDPEAWDSSPAFSLDGSTLYFASNRAGGIGGIDLYSARLDDRGNWTGVRNLGSSINTPGNELFPYVGPDEKLYFASDGHPGFGGLDLFVATREEGEITIENLGAPYNSNYDDFGLLYINFPYEGIFVSNRPGGKGDDDIYFFSDKTDEVKVINYIIAGKTARIEDNGAKSNLPAVRVKLLDSAGNVVQEAFSGLGGDFTFIVQAEKSYTLSAEKADFFLKRQPFSTIGKGIDPKTVEELQTNVAFDVELVLEPIVIDKAIVLENIYYDFDRADIREDAAQELDKLVQILLDNPDIQIELSAHTDNRGSAAYNQRLSQQRAESAVNYIVSKGIEASRITAKGYGASQPIAPNSNPDGTDNPDGRQLNRRTEFKVISISNKN
jgi:peptidoglycan-associated lipoprotein